MKQGRTRSQRGNPVTLVVSHLGTGFMATEATGSLDEVERELVRPGCKGEPPSLPVVRESSPGTSARVGTGSLDPVHVSTPSPPKTPSVVLSPRVETTESTPLSPTGTLVPELGKLGVKREDIYL